MSKSKTRESVHGHYQSTWDDRSSAETSKDEACLGLKGGELFWEVTIFFRVQLYSTHYVSTCIITSVWIYRYNILEIHFASETHLQNAVSSTILAIPILRKSMHAACLHIFLVEVVSPSALWRENPPWQVRNTSFGRSFHVISKNSTLVMGWFMAHEDELVPLKPGGFSGSRPPQWDNGAGGGSSWPRVLSEAWLRHRCSALLGPWLHLQTHKSMQCLPHSARCRLGIVQKSASKPMILVALDFEPPCNNDGSSHLYKCV